MMRACRPNQAYEAGLLQKRPPLQKVGTERRQCAPMRSTVRLLRKPIPTVGVLRTLPMLPSLPQPLMLQHNLWLLQYVLFRRDATKA